MRTTYDPVGWRTPSPPATAQASGTPSFTLYRAEGPGGELPGTRPDAPGSSPKKSAPPFAAAAQPASRDSRADQTTPPNQLPPATPLPLRALGLGTLSVVLFARVVVFATQASTREKTRPPNRNRAAQHAAAITLPRAQLDVAKLTATQRQTQGTETLLASALLKTRVDETQAGAARLRSQLNKARTISHGFQSPMEDAKAAPIRPQGVAAIAKSQASLLQPQLDEATTDIARLLGQLEASRARSATLHARAGKVEAAFIPLQKIPPKN